MSEPLSADIRIGTSGYSYPGASPKGWYGSFYPETRAKNFDELEYYSSFFDTVEINSSFYRPPSPGMAESWARRTPPHFDFAVKAWQKFTHATKVGEGAGGTKEKWESATADDIDLFQKSIDPLAGAGKLGALLFQFPPGFHFNPENAEKLSWTLRAFRDYPKTVELRHKSWSDAKKETQALLPEAGAAWAFIDEPQFPFSIERDEPLGEIFYLRLHGRNRTKWWNHQEAWERYDYFYGRDEIRFFADKIREAAQKSPRTKIYVFFNNHARGQAAANGLMLKRELGMEMVPPPGSLAEAYPQLGR